MEKLAEKIRGVLQAHPGVLFAYLFGSVARGQGTACSDLDLAVFLRRDADPAEAKLDIIGRISDILGARDFDLVILNNAPLTLAGRIVRDRVVLYERDPFARHRYESLTLRKYFDFSRAETLILNRRYGFGG